MPGIHNSNVRLAYDGRTGARPGRHAHLVASIVFLHTEYNPSFMGQAARAHSPQSFRNYQEYIRGHPEINCRIFIDVCENADRIRITTKTAIFVDVFVSCCCSLYVEV
ncbi:MAG: hypothetical protein IPG32_21455 [Saprospirales bacterium]|nr:hypothetical protein [Saprospirales bacterium]